MKIYIPILCINGTKAIHVSPSTDERALFNHCYALKQIHPERIDSFWILPVELGEPDDVFLHKADLIGKIERMRRELYFPDDSDYLEYLFSLNVEAVEVIAHDIAEQRSSRLN